MSRDMSSDTSRDMLDGTVRGLLLERAVRYARRVVGQVRIVDLALPTPCAEWDLLHLLRHLDESVATVREAVEHGCVFPGPAPSARVDIDVLLSIDRQTGLLLAAWDGVRGDRSVAVGPRPVPAAVLADTAALEIAVHGWDVASTCGIDPGMPPGLAVELLAVARRVLPWPRSPLFAPEVVPVREAGPDDLLVAFLGRRPRW
jgi:uncharacterized protein (TIGR03086 family)